MSAEYIVIMYSDTLIEKKWIDEFFSRDEIIVMKKTKKKVDKPINILDYVRAWEVIGHSMSSVTLRLVLDAGGERNLKPDVLVRAFCDEHPQVCADNSDIHRNKIFCKTSEITSVSEIF